MTTLADAKSQLRQFSQMLPKLQPGSSFNNHAPGDQYNNVGGTQNSCVGNGPNFSGSIFIAPVNIDKRPTRSLSEPPAKRSRLEDEDTTNVESQDKTRWDLNKFIVFVVVSVVISPLISFCWRLIFISFYFTYEYLVIFLSSLSPALHALSPRSVIKVSLNFVVMVLLIAWSLSLTPAILNLGTPYPTELASKTTDVVYDAGKDVEVDIFAIYGLSSDPNSVWAYKTNDTKVSWLSDLLPKVDGLQDIRVVTVNHQIRLDSNTAHMGLQYHAFELLESIQRLHKANPDRPIIFIAHGFGGLLLKKALLLAKSRSKDVAAMTRGIIFVGVSHTVSYSAYVEYCFSCIASFRRTSSDLLGLMSVDAPALLELESEFYDTYVIQYHSHDPQPYICDILELRPGKIEKLVLGSLVKPKYGQLRHGRLIALDTDHRGLIEFQSRDDPNFQTFSRVVSQAFDHALRNIPAPEEKFPPPLDPPVESEPLHRPKGLLWMPGHILTAGILGGLQELLASWLAMDRGMNGRYLTSRVPKVAVYTTLVKMPVEHAIIGALQQELCSRESHFAKIILIVVSNFIVSPIQYAVHLSVMAIIAGARTHHQICATVKAGLRPVMMISWVTSPICLAFAWYFLPAQLWVHFFDVIAFIIGTYIDSKVKKMRLAVLRRRYFADRIEKPLPAAEAK